MAINYGEGSFIGHLLQEKPLLPELIIYESIGINMLFQCISLEAWKLNGKGMARRPFKERIQELAEPEIKKIYSEPYR